MNKGRAIKGAIETGERLVAKHPRPGQAALLVEVLGTTTVVTGQYGSPYRREHSVYRCRVVDGAATSALNTPGTVLEYRPTELRAFFYRAH
jgi:hypothetical protein